MSSVTESNNNISNPFDNLMAYLEGKENGIKTDQLQYQRKK